jgi:hypothetical protein
LSPTSINRFKPTWTPEARSMASQRDQQALSNRQYSASTSTDDAWLNRPPTRCPYGHPLTA